MTNGQDYETLRRYLLDQEPEEEADRLEQRMLADDELFELACAAEDEILDDCVRGRLRRAECDGLAARLAKSQAGHERIALARTLAKAAERWEKRALRRKVGTLAASLVAAVLCVHMAIPNQGSIALDRQLRSASPVQTVEVTLGRWTKLEVDLGSAEGDTFHATIKTKSGEPVWSEGGLRPAADGYTLVLSLPPFRLSPGRYRLEVMQEDGGAEKKEALREDFRVVR